MMWKDNTISRLVTSCSCCISRCGIRDLWIFVRIYPISVFCFQTICYKRRL